MKYEDPLINEDIHGNVNVSGENPYITLLKLMMALAGVLVVAYFLLSMFVFQLVRFISFETEKRWFDDLSSTIVETMVSDDELTRKKSAELQRIADKLIQAADASGTISPFEGMTVELYYSDSSTANAFAVPGGKIVVMKGLVDAMPDENALAMVIGHEIAHVKHRDALNALGRGLLSQVILSVFVGSDISIASEGLGFLTNSHSRSNERDADELGLMLLYSAYDNAYGATTFFEQMVQVESSSVFASFNSTHPLSKDRIEQLQRLIKDNGYTIDATAATVMPDVLRK